jgi:signal transduction histidine kinase
LLPINKIIQQIKKIKVNDLSIRIDEGNKKDEIALLAMNFNKMLDKLQNSFDSQKLFLAGASHELKTPLTSIMGEIEVTLMKNRTDEEYRYVLNSILDEIKLLNSLTNSLLELAQTSADFANLAHSNIRIDELLISVQRELLEKFIKKEIKVNFIKLPDDEKHIMVSGNENLLKIAIKNIVDNACKYSENNVEVNFDFDEKFIYLIIKDSGIGISEDEKQKIFTPFFRAQNTKSVKGRGIGLSIVKKIIELHDGDIIVNSKLNQGSEFIVKLPNLIKF